MFNSILNVFSGGKKEEVRPNVYTKIKEPDALSRSNVTDFSYVWKIEKFSFQCDSKCESPVFAVYGHETLKFQCSIRWELVMHNGSLIKQLNLYLRLVSSDRPFIKLNYNAFLFNDKEELLSKRISAGVFTLLHSKETEVLVLCSGQGIKHFLMKLLPKDTLTVVFELAVEVGPRVSFKLSEFETKKVRVNLANDFQKLFENGDFSDVTFVVGDKSLKAHKAILASRSKVFAAMFHSNMMENNSNRIDITDIECDVFQEILQYIYTGEAPKIDLLPAELLEAADKYLLEELKKMCELALVRNLNIDNASKAFILASQLCEKDIKTNVMEFIVNNFAVIIMQDYWTYMMKECPELVKEILTVQAARK